MTRHRVSATSQLNLWTTEALMTGGRAIVHRLRRRPLRTDTASGGVPADVHRAGSGADR